MCTTAAKKIDDGWFLIKTRDPVSWMRWDDEIKLFNTPADRFKKLIVKNPDDGLTNGVLNIFGENDTIFTCVPFADVVGATSFITLTLYDVSKSLPEQVDVDAAAGILNVRCGAACILIHVKYSPEPAGNNMSISFCNIMYDANFILVLSFITLSGTVIVLS